MKIQRFKKHYHKFIFILLSPLILSSCGLFAPVETPETKTYQIQPTSQLDTHKSSKPEEGILRIETMQSALPYNSTNMYYTLNNNEIKPYAYSRWVAPPSNMIGNMLLEQIDYAQIYENTVSPLFLGQINYRLSTILLELNQHMKNHQSYTSIKILAQLTNNQTGSVVKQHLFSIQAPSDSTPYGMANAISQSSDVLIEQMVAWLRNKPIPKAQIPISADKSTISAATEHSIDRTPNVPISTESKTSLPSSKGQFYHLY